MAVEVNGTFIVSIDIDLKIEVCLIVETKYLENDVL
jgi:hypothetical protein